jgi:DNA-directed RNA polymerase subunit RPC12/RpoP
VDIVFNCDACEQSIAIDEAGAGSVVECPKCRARVLVPNKSTPTTTPSPLVSKQCPFCAETIKAEAIVCRYCGRDLVEKRLAEAVARKVQGPAKSDVPRSDDPEWAVELSQANTPARRTERVRVAGDVAGGSVNPPSFGVIVVLTILLPIIGLIAGIVWLCNPKYRGAGGAILAVALVLIVIYAVLFAGGC